MPRDVTLVLLDGRVLSSFEVELPWWQEVSGVIEGARAHHGLEISVLRIVETEPGLTNGGKVTYLVETPGMNGAHEDHPLRPDYAKPGGPSRSIEWARSVLDRPITSVEQLRTWNLSAIWRLGTPSGTVWLKQVPRFFAHEAVVLRYLRKPVLLAADDQGRMLLDDLPGEDLYDCDFETRRAIAADMVEIQLKALPQLEKLHSAGIPLMLGLPSQPWLADALARVAACGMPDTLVHGDLHPGNVRGTPLDRTIIDWGDCFIGHPGFDILRLSDGLLPVEAADLLATWAMLWRRAVPGCDPVAAADALRPVAALRNSAVYSHFLFNIEPSEHRYHAADVSFWLAEAQLLAAR
ncbi:MAG TPA: aminoglycoside phosphotransferase family protein [Micromonosporaceae bacterium]|nr:aminoglycoside phosphotransferase family protein [Micromonosporaceae bacterium]